MIWEMSQETFDHSAGMKTVVKKKGAFASLLEKLAQDNAETYGGGPPKCH